MKGSDLWWWSIAAVLLGASIVCAVLALLRRGCPDLGSVKAPSNPAEAYNTFNGRGLARIGELVDEEMCRTLTAGVILDPELAGMVWQWLDPVERIAPRRVELLTNEVHRRLRAAERNPAARDRLQRARRALSTPPQNRPSCEPAPSLQSQTRGSKGAA